jgi:multiple sugar transport system permease protein
VSITTAPTTSTATKRPGRRGATMHTRTRTALLMIAPALLGLILFVVVPFITAGWLSLHNVRLNSGRPSIWFGLTQYSRILSDPEFFRSLLNVAIFAVVVVPLQTTLALALALLCNQPLRGMPIFRTCFFLPVVFPMALVATIWKLIYSRGDQGMLNSVLHALSFGQIGPIDWLGSTNTALLSIIIMSIWQGVGFQMIILLAGLQGIPAERYEAATLDRANSWQRFRHITVPGIRNTLIFVVMVTTIFSFRLFDQVYILTQGGPNDATTTVMFQAVTSAFSENNVGRGAAITVVFFIIVLAITLVQRRILKEEREIV